jgi:hypothetical protein
MDLNAIEHAPVIFRRTGTLVRHEVTVFEQ